MAANTLNPPPTRLISFQQLVIEADPTWQKERMRPVIYEFSDGRKFVMNPAVYTSSN